MKILFLIILIGSIQISYAQQVIPLYEGRVPNNKTNERLPDSEFVFQIGNKEMHFTNRVVIPQMVAYLPEREKTNGIAVIICPGGSYSGLAIDPEGIGIAKKLSENGVAGFVLKYRLPNSNYVNNKEFVPLQDAQRAIQIVRENAQQWGINPHKIGIEGSSAGGHLASTAGTHFNKEQIDNPQRTSLRPDFMILNYPVISFADSLTHYSTRFNLIGEMPSDELSSILSDFRNSEKRLAKFPVSSEKIKEYSNELQVTSETPPTFITHSVDDFTVPVQNSILFIAALQKNKVSVESFFYAKGGHGYGVDNPTSDVEWIDSCITWLLSINNHP